MTRLNGSILAVISVMAILGVGGTAAAGVHGPALSLGTEAGEFGAAVQGAFGSETDFGVGGRLLIGLADGFEAMPGFTYYFPDEGLSLAADFSGVELDVSYWEIDLDLAYHLTELGTNSSLYVGGGIAVGRVGAELRILGFEESESDTKVGANLLGGIRFRSTPSLFVELRGTIGGPEQVIVMGGVGF